MKLHPRGLGSQKLAVLPLFPAAIGKTISFCSPRPLGVSRDKKISVQKDKGEERSRVSSSNVSDEMRWRFQWPLGRPAWQCAGSTRPALQEATSTCFGHLLSRRRKGQQRLSRTAICINIAIFIRYHLWGLLLCIDDWTQRTKFF